MTTPIAATSLRLQRLGRARRRLAVPMLAVMFAGGLSQLVPGGGSNVNTRTVVPAESTTTRPQQVQPEILPPAESAVPVALTIPEAPVPTTEVPMVVNGQGETGAEAAIQVSSQVVSAPPLMPAQPEPVAVELPKLAPGEYTEVADNLASFSWPEGTEASSTQMTRDAQVMRLMTYASCDADGRCSASVEVTNTSGVAMRWTSGVSVEVLISFAGEVVQTLEATDPDVLMLAPGQSHTMSVAFRVSAEGRYDVTGSTTFEVP